MRSRLSVFDDRNGMFESRVDDHPALGKLDYVHIPLAVLERHFPDEYKCLNDYKTFAVIRGVHDRFASALAQYCNYQTKIPFKRHSRTTIIKQAYDVIERLEALSFGGQCPALLPPDLIHFQPQIDYVFSGEKRIVDTLVPITNIDAFVNELLSSLGTTANCEEGNASVTYRNGVLRSAANFANRLIPAPGRFIPVSLRPIVASMIYQSRHSNTMLEFEDQRVREFISSFYSRDFPLLDLSSRSPKFQAFVTP